MVMVTLSHDAQGHLDRYLRQVKAALRGHSSVDAGEVERDVLGHIEAELAGQPEPIGPGSLQEVLNRLGTPDRWVPPEELPQWRRLFNRLHSGPEDWRLAYLTMVSFVIGFWLPPLLFVSLAMARATLAQLEGRDEPIGPRRWLVYPPLVLFYVSLGILMLIGPVPGVIVAFEDPLVRGQVAAWIPGPFWIVAPSLVVLAAGLWWMILGLLLRRFTNAIQLVFWPFAERFNRRHATRVALTGLLLAALAGAMLIAILAWDSTPSVRAAEQIAPRPAVPAEPISAVLDAFRSHSVVALGEGAHGNEQGHVFRLSLVRDPRFPALVNDIVVESGNARYQDVMDRFVRGEHVPHDSLRRVWQNTTQPHALWDVPIYEEFFRAVRSVNGSLPRDRQLRVLLGDPPIDWASLSSADDLKKWQSDPMADRDRHAVQLIQRDVLAKQRRALLVYGDMHFNRRNPLAKDGSDVGSNNIVDLLKKAGAPRVFTIHTETWRVDLRTLQPDVASWPRPSLAILRGTVLGAADFTSYFPAKYLIGADGKPINPTPMEDQFDAVLYLAPPSEITMSRLPPAMCADRAYMKMRMDRMHLAGIQPAADRLEEYCASVAPGVQAKRIPARLAAHS